MVGAAMVNPGPQMDGASIFELLDTEQVSFTAAVPTVWLMLLQHLEDQNLKLPYLDTVVIGGSAAPRMMIEKFEKDYDVEVNHAWGMTELSPLGTMGVLTGKMQTLSFDERVDMKVKQGRPPFLVQMKITDDDGNELPRDGKTFGNLKVKISFVPSCFESSFLHFHLISIPFVKYAFVLAISITICGLKELSLGKIE